MSFKLLLLAVLISPVLALAQAPTPVQATLTDTTAQKDGRLTGLLTKGDQFYDKAQYDSAAVVYASLTLLPSANAGVWVKLASCYQYKGSYRAAVAGYSKALVISPANAAALEGRAFCHMRTGNHALAINDYTQLLSTTRTAPLLRARAFCYQGLQQHKLAVADLTAVLQDAPQDTAALFLRGRSYRSLRSYLPAMTDLTKYIESNAANPTALYERGLCHDQLRNFQAALADYNAILKLDTGYSLARRSRAILYYQMSDIDNALSDFSTLIASKVTDQDLYNRALCYIAKQNWQAALTDLEQEIKMSAEDPDPYYYLGMCYNRTRQYDKAINALNQAVAYYVESQQTTSDTYARTFYERGMAYKAQQQMPLAIADLNQAIQLKPNFQAAIDEKATGSAPATVAAAPKQADTNISAAETFFKNKDYDSAIKTYSKAIQADPDAAILYQKRGLAYQSKNDLKNAFFDFNRAIALKTTDLSVYYYRGLLAEQQGSLANAIDDYTSAIINKAEVIGSYYKRADLHLRLREHYPAVNDYTKVLEAAPGDAQPWFYRGLAEYELGNYQKASADFNQAARIKTKDDRFKICQKLAYLADNHFADSKFVESVNINTGTFFDDYYFNMANRYIKVCEEDLAERKYKNAVKVLTRLMDDHDDARENKKAGNSILTVAQNPSLLYAHILAKLAWCHQQLNDEGQAIAFYKKAFDIDENVQDVSRKLNQLRYKDRAIADAMPPMLTVDSPPDSGIAYRHLDGTILVSGTVKDPSGIASLKINGLDADMIGNDMFRGFIDPTARMFSVRAVDKAGNRIDSSFTMGSHLRFDTLRDPRYTLATNERFHAIFIACREYKSQHWPSLPTTVSEAEELRKVLSAQYDFRPEDVDTIYNRSQAEILDGLKAKLMKLGNADNLLIYFGGHGWYDDAQNMAYWVPVGSESPAEYISNKQISELLSICLAKHVLVMADACFSGALRDGLAAEKKYEFTKKSRQLLSSGGTEVVPGKSVYLPAILTQLKSNQEKYMSARQLYGKVFKEINDATRKEPTLRDFDVIGNEGGQFYFRRK